jgi:hypothetical protein
MCNYHNMGTRTKLNFALNADEPVQQEQKRLATWGTDIPDDLVLDKELLEESLKKVSVTPCNLILLEFVFIVLCTFRLWFSFPVGGRKEERGER